MILSTTEKKLVVSTDYSGLGSFEEALNRLLVSHNIAFACDKDKFAKASYLANHNPDIFYNDITTRDNHSAPLSDMYVFGFPCQAFSLSGKRLGFLDARGTLFFNSLEYISLKRPRVFIAENVKGLLSHDKVKGSKSKFGRTFGVIRDALAATVNGQRNLYKYDDCVNYHIHYAVLNTKNFGVPQSRERIFLVGFRDEADAVRFQMPSKKPLLLRLKDLLQEEVDEKYNISDTVLKQLFKNIKSNVQPNGDKILLRWQNNTQGMVLDSIAPTLRASGSSDLRKSPYVLVPENTKKGYAIAELYDSINYSNPNSKTRRGRVGKGCASTLDTACNQAVIVPIELFNQIKSSHRNDGEYFFDGYNIRRLTPLECFRLQGYSDEFFEKCAYINSDTQLYKQAGNSITVDTIMHLLIQILKAIDVPYQLAA